VTDARIAIIVGGILLVLTPVMAQTNGYIGFTIYIDNASPTYNNFEGVALIDDLYDQFFTYAEWNDHHLTTYLFEWNMTGVFENDTAQSFDQNWSNVTKSMTNADEGKTIRYRFHGRDWSNNWNSTYYKDLVIASIAPIYSNVSQNNSNPTAGEFVQLTSYWTDNFEIDHVFLQTNETGSWLDNGTPAAVDTKSGWANFTIDTTGMSGPFYWRIQGQDKISNVNNTPINYFTVS